MTKRYSPLPWSCRSQVKLAVRHVWVILTEVTATRSIAWSQRSDGGVRIFYTAANLEPPNEFTLWFASTEGNYRVIWHKGLFTAQS
jgi:hypothetical protein